ALPGLPSKSVIDVYCSMTPKQRKQYDKFAKDAEIRIDDQRLSATNVLAEYARLKQFANAMCTLETRDNGELVVMPTEESGKLQDLLEKLDQEGIRKVEPEPRARAIVSSESKRMVDMVTVALKKAGIHCDSLTGDTLDSGKILKKFKSGDEEPYVIVMTTTTGGVSLNLEETGSVHILDETWNPDDQEQLEDRGDRGSRTESLRVYYYRTKDSIQEYIARVTDGKAVTNKNVLDIRRLMREAMEES
ncbi:MAG TPA: DEAD/DEAH box helicase, partial [Nitrospiraceae bacterium]|nr:DEAD/DEAH box helicase [Nitrospiraceae bacterium]